MLPALANGLREGGRFDVLPVPLSDGGAAAAAAPRADAVAVFYGAPGRPLAATVQMLAAAVRGKGGRIIAVLQREAVAQRDECFRAGASDLLFMPMSKEQFVSRLEAAVALAYTPDKGPAADVQVNSRAAQVKLPHAVVTAAGVHASTAVPFLPGLATPPGASTVAAQPDAAPKPEPGSGVDSSLFTPASVAPVAPAVEPVVWPVPVALETAKAAVLAALFSPDDEPTVPVEVMFSAKKVAATLSGGEKAAIERLGVETHFADAAGERVALDVARAEGMRLMAASEPSRVDDAALKALTQRVDAVVASLQKDADGAIARGEVEALQVVRASNAALSRDVP